MLDKYFTASSLSNEEYHSDKAYHGSTDLKPLVEETAAHYLFRRENPREESDSLILGSAIHAALLEPEVFRSKYVVSQKFDRRTTKGKAAHQAFEEKHAGKTVIQAEDVTMFSLLRKKILAHKTAYNLLTAPGEAESSIFWTDDETGLKLKVRPDRIVYFGATPIYVSLKSTQCAKLEVFREKDIPNFNYAMSEAMYRDGIYQKFNTHPHTLMIVIEKGTWEVCVYELDQKLLDYGYEQYRTAVHTLKGCLDSGLYPGYQNGDDVQMLDLPRRFARSGQRGTSFMRKAA